MNMANRQSAKEISLMLQDFGSHLMKYPGFTPHVWPFIRKLRRQLDNALVSRDPLLAGCLTNVYNRVQSIWDNICSVVSGKIPLQVQGELLYALGKYVKDIGDSMSLSAKDMALKCMEACGELSQTDAALKKHIPISEESKQTRKVCEFDTARLERTIDKASKRRLVELVAKTGCLEMSEEPVFMLRAGYRSFYFFSGAVLYHGPTTSKEYIDIVAPSMDGLVSKLPKTQQHYLAFTRRAAGETSGAASIASELSSRLNLPHLMLPPPTVDAFVERVDGVSYPPAGTSLIFVDDVVTSGLSASTWLRRLQEQGLRVRYYHITFDRRSTTECKFDEFPEVDVVSALTKADLIAAGMWKPEILLCRADSKWLPAMDFTCDYLHECCIYFDKEELYAPLKDEFDNLIAEQVADSSILDSPLVMQFYRNLFLLYIYDFAKFFEKLERLPNEK